MFGDIFLFFIVFGGPRLRSLVFTRCATRNDDFGSQNHFFTALCETGPWSLQKGRGPSDGESPKMGLEKHIKQYQPGRQLEKNERAPIGGRREYSRL